MSEQAILPFADESGGFPPWLRYPAAPGLRDLDVALGRFLFGCAPDSAELAVRLAMLCSAHLAQGNPCLDLAGLCHQGQLALPEGWRDDSGGTRPEWLPKTWQGCRAALDAASFVGDGRGEEPLVRHGRRLYLARYWRAGARIRDGITSRLPEMDESQEYEQAAREWLSRVFPPSADEGLDWQKIACANALLQRFALITGGPGTGKTTTVVQLLAVLQGLAQAQGRVQGLCIRLAAPTGKAAARLNASIAGALQRLREGADAGLRAALDCVPSQVVTLHKLLGSRPDTRQFTHRAGHPLDLDVLVVDEASMMDVEMMDAVLAALPASARLILLGDRDQLASVEAGALLGELCARAAQGHYRPRRCARLQALCGQSPGEAYQDAQGSDLDQAVVMLRHSHRFGDESGIGRFARAVNAGDTQAVAALLDRPPAGLRFVAARAAEAAPSGDWLAGTSVLGEAGHAGLFEAMRDDQPAADAVAPQWDRWAAALLDRQGRFQVLCALRTGPWGVEGLNRLIESRLRAADHIPDPAGSWYAGRPVLVTRNQPALGLSNGDIGLTLRVPDWRRAGLWALRVAFPGSEAGTVRWVSPARLSDVATVYALTVHKSQGSEFDQVVLVLPDRLGPLLTRELLYTGITRARRSLVLVLPGTPSLLESAVRHPTQRAGGIWDPDG
ncbi:RecBCD enzyme subunit RecD OS=Castellaniella defragrans OX=75697 GN=recD PE=3 SV=1 [Castellaniella defragrans]